MTHREEKVLSSGHTPIEVFYSYTHKGELFRHEPENIWASCIDKG